MKKSLPTHSQHSGGEIIPASTSLDGYVSEAPTRQRVDVRRRTIPLAGRLMRKAIACYEDHARLA
jgi:hypothetical protein